MASFFRRRRSLIVKAVIVIPVIWFLAVLFVGHGPQLSQSPRDEGDGFLPDIFKKPHKEEPLQPPGNPNHPDGMIHEDSGGRADVQIKRNPAEEEDSIRRLAEERRREEAERKRKEEALKFESERKARENQVDPNAPGKSWFGCVCVCVGGCSCVCVFVRACVCLTLQSNQPLQSLQRQYNAANTTFSEA